MSKNTNAELALIGVMDEDDVPTEGTTEPIFGELTPEQTAAKRDHERLAAIEEAEQRVADCESAWESAKSEAKCCKDAFDAAVLRLRNVITSKDDGQQDLPFSEPSEAWRAVHVDTLGLASQTVAALVEANRATIGDLADWTAHNPLTDLKGIGDAKACAIEDALTEFWSQHPEYTKPESDTE